MPVINTTEDLIQLLRENPEYMEAARRELLANHGQPESGPAPVEFDGTVVSQKILSAVIRTGESHDADHIVDVLHGVRTHAILELGHDGLSVFGIEPNMSGSRILTLIDQLVERRLAAMTPGTHPVLFVTSRGRAFLKQHESITLPEPQEERAQGIPDEPEYDVELFEQLRVLRKQLADERQVSAFVVFSNATLREMSSAKPLDYGSMLAINGVGRKRISQYGASFILAIADHLGVTPDLPGDMDDFEDTRVEGTTHGVLPEASPSSSVRAQTPEEKFLSRLFGRPVRARSEDPANQQALADVIAGAISSLVEREAHIVTRRFGLVDGREHTLQEIGQDLGVSRERIRQLEARALRKLRRPSRRPAVDSLVEDDTP